MEVPKSRLSRLFLRKSGSGSVSEKNSRSIQSYSGPRKAAVAMSAPADDAVTCSNTGRSPDSVQPTSTPAP